MLGCANPHPLQLEAIHSTECCLLQCMHSAECRLLQRSGTSMRTCGSIHVVTKLARLSLRVQQAGPCPTQEYYCLCLPGCLARMRLVLLEATSKAARG